MKEVKKLFRYFIFIFLVVFLVINWNEVSWVFNYKVIFGFISDFFHKEQTLAETNKEINDENNAKPNTELKKEIKFEYSEKENSIEIPKIGVLAPLIFDKGLDDKGVYKAMDRGAVLYPKSALPGEPGQTIILGHSAPPNWPKVKYDWIFSQLNDLEVGDKIFVYFEKKKYSYLVKNKIFLERGEELPQDLTNFDNMLILISCWPPGKDIKRIAVVAK